MSTHRLFDRLCAAAIAVAVLVSILLWGLTEGNTAAAQTPAYVNGLFDTSYVHSIDIVMDDPETFLANCENEEYVSCSVVIDGKSMKNVALRAKGNTSLSTVSSLNSQRYSFKLEFDHYQKGRTFQGLDKLCLNNLIQDNTMIKDYLSYTMMKEFGVDTPLCSFVYIRLNGEDWGLYLAVESVEDSFLTRNYSSTEGDLYKPDSMSFGGGRGNGMEFNMDDFDFSALWNSSASGTEASSDNSSGDTAAATDSSNQNSDQGFSPSSGSSGGGSNGNSMSFPGSMPTGDSAGTGNTQNTMPSFPGSNSTTTDSNGNTMPAFPGNMPSNDSTGTDSTQSAMPSFPGNMPGSDSTGTDSTQTFPGNMPSGGFPGNMTQESSSDTAADSSSSATMPGNMPSGNFPGNMAQSSSSDSSSGSSGFPAMPNFPGNNGGGGMSFPGGDFPGGGDGKGFSFGMGSSDVKLQYTDDDPASYSNIFDNAKTKVTDEDKARLIQSLKSLNEGENIESVVDVDEVLRYFVVHNFIRNGDSYTGTMIHNYYLYEENGQLSMIPWDYNLGYGTFQGMNASSEVNADIDQPVDNGSIEDRPMVAWIFNDESYTEQYHTLMSEFIDSWFTNGEMETMIESLYTMLRPYVEKDPTKFCTLEEFDQGIQTITSFVTLRAQSIRNQLSGSTETVDTTGLTLSDMGTMNQGNMGGGFDNKQPMQMPADIKR